MPSIAVIDDRKDARDTMKTNLDLALSGDWTSIDIEPFVNIENYLSLIVENNIVAFLLDERENISYPDGIEDSDGMIRIIYDYDRYGESCIMMAGFTEEDILAGKCVTSGSFLKRVINQLKSDR